ncbi:MAG: arylsulfatase [Pirellulales bacterium]|nr:arylsulfatase [Pirellulales bacterium]
MSRSFRLALVLLAVEVGLIAASAAAAPPNFLVVLADDLGFSDLGCYGGEIATPQLDALAAGGLRYTQFYNTARCWPTRAALLTGYYAQQVGRDALPQRRGGAAGQRPAWAQLLPEYLRPLGYRSYHSGKWHVDGRPLAAGFDRSYELDDHNNHFHPQKHFEDGHPLPPVKPGENYFSTTAIAAHAIEYLAEHARSHSDRPFFCYVAFTAPHFPIQAPADDVARCAERYGCGWDAIRAARFARQRTMLHLPGELAPLERNIGPPYKFPELLQLVGPGEVDFELPWNELDDGQRAFQAMKMAVHAAMVEGLDRETGRLIAQLRSMGALDNTLVLFLSDNGASAELMVRGDGHDRTAPAGSDKTFLCLGPGWSRAANTPFRRHKTWVHEGGIATPLVAHWPAGIAAQGELRRAVGHVIDLAPTLLHLAGGTWPVAADGRPPSPGRDLAPSFAADVPLPREPLWWLHEGNRALRDGDWKLVAAKQEPWQLYDLSRDRSEVHDLAVEEPQRVADMAERWQQITDEFERQAAVDR